MKWGDGLDKMEPNGETLFHIQLLSRVIDMDRYPFVKLIIEKELSREECSELMKLLVEINQMYEVQKEEGLLDYTSLLIHFAGMLNEKLHPDITIASLKHEGYFVPLMDEFSRILERESKKQSRRK